MDQLLLIKKWTTAGLSLDRIRDLLAGGDPQVPARARRPGGIEVVSHLHVADGVELLIEPGRAGLMPEQVRHLIQGVMSLFQQVQSAAPPPAAPTPHST